MLSRLVRKNWICYSPWRETDCNACECRRCVCSRCALDYRVHKKLYRITPPCFKFNRFSRRPKTKGNQKVAKVKKKKTHRDWIKSIYPWKPYKKRRDATKNSLPQLEVYKEKKGIEWIRTRVSTFIQLSHARQMFRLSKLIFSFSQNINCPISRRRHQKFTKVALHFWDVRPIRSWREADSSCRVKFNQVDDGIGGIFFTVSNALRSAWCGDL